MTTLVVLFNLKRGTDRAAFDRWAREKDWPAVRAMKNCEGFESLAVKGLLGSDAAAPYQFVEVIRLRDLAAFQEELGADEALRAIAADFDEFVESPVFLVTETNEP